MFSVGIVAAALPVTVLAATEIARDEKNILTKEEQAKIHRAPDAKKIVRDKNGVTRYVVDMLNDTTVKASVVLTDDALIDWEQANSKSTIQKVLRDTGNDIKPMLALEHSIPGMIAYLTEKQVENLAKDKSVSRITEDHYSEMSAPPPTSQWFDTPNSPDSQTRSWGIKAMNNLYPTPSNGVSTGPHVTRVFVIDLGIRNHPDLNNVVERVAALPYDLYGYPMALEGCWPHATHVAGIIGAADNSQGVVGMLPGVQITSIAIGDANYYLDSNNKYQQAYGNSQSSRVCSDGGSGFGTWSVAGVAAALDVVNQRASKGGGIVNMSLNAPLLFRHEQTLWNRMRYVAKTRYVEGTWRPYYFGSLIVQSAGNNGMGACDYAYEDTDPYDGIIVVGGLNEGGNRLYPPGGIGGVPAAAGSNDGACVEMWAPSSNITSSWADGGEFGNPTGYGLLTGTSMAAPHVAGFAAALRQQNPVGASGGSLEQRVRQYLHTLPSGYQMPSF